MKKLLLLLFTIVSCSFFNEGKAQVGFSNTNVINYQDTVFSSDSAVYTVSVQNKSNGPLTGTWQVILAIDSGVGIMIIDSILFNASLQPQDTFPVVLNKIYFNHPAIQKNGGNVVVIWPMFGNEVPIDTIRKPLYVIEITGITESTGLDKHISIYPNPSNGRISVVSSSIDYPVEKVRILSIQGAVLKQELFNQELDIYDLANGYYFVEIQSGQERVVYKILKH